jgi:hypothetical protein
MRTNLGQSLMAVLVLAGCSTNPQPFPMPLSPPDPKAIFISNPEQGTASTVTIGLPGAVTTVADGVEVVLGVTPHAQQQRGPVFGDGSFSVKLGSLLAGDKLEAWLEHEGTESTRVELPWLSETPNDAAFSIDSVSPVQAGLCTIKGRWNAGSQILAGNTRNGAAGVATVAGAGDFSLSIAAAAGDKLTLFGRTPGTGVSTTFQEVTVPGP